MRDLLAFCFHYKCKEIPKTYRVDDVFEYIPISNNKESRKIDG